MTRVLKDTEYTSNKGIICQEYWLRSRGKNTWSVNAVPVYIADGSIAEYIGEVSSTAYACLPALNLNQESVIFAFLANESGQSGTKGAKDGTVEAEHKNFELPTGYNNEYKLTMMDKNHKDFRVYEAPVNLKMITGVGINVPIKYSNVQISDIQKGTKEYISVMLTKKVEDGNYAYNETKYYGKSKELIAVDNGEATLTLKDIEPGEYTLKIFNE